jgi:hypothetical protein
MASIKTAHQVFAKHLVEQIENRLSWENNDQMIYQAPEETIFLGAFSESDADHTKNGMVYPNHIGVQFNIGLNRIKTKASIEIEFLCDFFYRIPPSYNEQIDYLINNYMGESGYEDNDRPSLSWILAKKYLSFIGVSNHLKQNLTDVSIQQVITSVEKHMNNAQFGSQLFELILSEIDSNIHQIVNQSFDSYLQKEISSIGLSRKNREIALKYQKYHVSDFPKLKFVIDRNETVLNDREEILKKFNEQFNNILHEEIVQIKDILKATKRPRVKDVLNEVNYSGYLDYSEKTDVPFPNWKTKIGTDIIRSADSLFFDIIFSNESNKGEGEIYDFNRPYSTKIYNAQIKVRLLRNDFHEDIPAFEKIDVTDLLSSYRYDFKKLGRGLNCGVSHNYVDGVDTLRTQNLSIHTEKRRKTREYSNVSLKFEDFAGYSIKQLENISQALKEDLADVNENISRFHINPNVYKAAKKDYDNLVMEVNRFDFGIECIKTFPDAHKAFIYLNETFALESHTFDSWRLFQIVFIVSNIPDMIVGEYGVEELSAIRKYKVEDMVDIIYFSTGGGKTEAFLGCVLFSLFFDRLRGKSKGLTAIIKYPLRLLSIQQVDRVMKKIVFAQVIKEKHQLKGDNFSLGYFVGGGNTPNRIDDYQETRKSIIDFSNDFQQIYECPLCGSKVILKVRIEEKTIRHYCENKDCRYHDQLPYLFIDDEIYRNVPSVLISTLDKFAVMAINNRFKALLLIDQDGKTHCKDPVPTLSIIDEIHLIKESLGTFSSHYESIFYYYCSHLIKDFGLITKKIKYMGATATISNYKYQVKELFMKDAHLFPAISPDIKKDFYSYVDEEDITRIIVAIMPFGVSPINYILRLIGLQREIVAYYLEHPEELSILFDQKLSKDEIIKVLYSYYIMIQYSNTKRDASRIRNGVDAFINASSNLKDVYKIPTDTILTGDTKFEHVKSLLSDIAKSNNPVEDDIPNYITATSMISHGVDNDKFNSIFFLGLPTLFAEFIQAYSRVGRKYTGIVFDIVRPIRVREESFLTNFNEYMEYKELMISPIPISRYSIGGLKKTFNGTLLSILRQYALPKSRTLEKLSHYKHFRELLEEIREKPLAKIIKLIYSHGENDGSEFNQRINQLVKETFVFIYDQSNAKSKDRSKIEHVIAQVNSTNERPMRSLRDTDKPVIIGLKEDKRG